MRLNFLKTNSTCQFTLAFFQLSMFKHIHHRRHHPRMSLHVHVHVKPFSTLIYLHLLPLFYTALFKY